MKISSIIDKKGDRVITVKSTSTILDAITLMNDNNIGALLVTSITKRLVGIITERDILRETAVRSGELHKTKVEDVMTRNLIVATPDDEVEESLGVMTENRIRHLPIIKNNKIAGIVSIGDLVSSQLDEITFHSRRLEEYIQIGY